MRIKLANIYKENITWHKTKIANHYIFLTFTIKEFLFETFFISAVWGEGLGK